MKKFSKLLFVTVFAVLLCCSVALFGCGKGGSKELNALGTPTGLAYADGSLSWTAVEGASSGYTVIITQGETEVRKDVNVTGTTYGLQTLEGGNYTAKVSANAVEGKNKASAEASLDFTVIAAPVSQKLATPANVTYAKATQTVTFDAVPNATAYIISATEKGSSDVTISEREITDTSIALTTLSLDSAEHTLKIIAKGNGTTWTDSDAAIFELTIETVKLGQTENISYNDKTDELEWTAVTGADGYTLVISKGTDDPIEKDSLSNSWSAEELPSGDFTITVRANAEYESIFWEHGDAKSGTFTISSMGELKAPESLEVKSGSIAWADNNARGYDVKIYRTANGTDKQGDAIQIADSVMDEAIDGCALKVAAMGLGDGGYIAEIKAISNRHTTSESAAVSKSFTIDIQKRFTAEEIAEFVGSAPRGEHAAVEFVTEGAHAGTAVVRPDNTPDGWGRVCSPDIAVDWDKKPVVFLEMQDVEIGGYHMQLYYNGNPVDCMRDSKKAGSTVVDLLKESGKNYTGMSSVALRLGVDNSYPEASNNARAYYKSVTMMYVTDFVQGLTEETKLGTPENISVDSYGVLAFGGVQYAKQYKLEITDAESNKVVNEILTATTYDLTGLSEGIYTVNLVAQNTTNEFALDSDPAQAQITVNTLVEFTAEELAVGNKFVSGEHMTAVYDSATGFTTLNGDHSEDYGWITMKDGITVNFAHSPLVMITVESVGGSKPTYLSRAVWDGQGMFAPRGDTPANITSTTIVTIRAGYNENGANYGTGTKENYKFSFGVSNKSDVVLSGLKIVEIYDSTPLARPDTPEKLAAPQDVSVRDRSTIVASTVSGNAEYTPTYKITVKEKDNASATPVIELTNQELPQILLSGLNLTSGTTYTVSFVAEGDSDEDKPFFTDSDPKSIDIQYTQKFVLDDFSAIAAQCQKVQGDNITAVADGTGLKISLPTGWGFMSVPVVMDQTLITDISALEIYFDNVIGVPQFSSRYYNALYSADKEAENTYPGDGEGMKACTGDKWIPANKVLVDTNLPSNATFVDIGAAKGFYVGLGHGGGGTTGDDNGTQVKAYTVTKLVVAEYKEVK